MSTQNIADIETVADQLPIFFKNALAKKQEVTLMGKKKPLGVLIPVDEYKRYQEWKGETSKDNVRQIEEQQLIQKEADELKRRLKHRWKGKNKDIVITQEEIDANCY